MTWLDDRRGIQTVISTGAALETQPHCSNPTKLPVKITRSSADADNGRDAFSGQSRSTNIVPFHMLHIVSYCAIVTCL